MSTNYDHLETELGRLRESYDEVVNKLFNIEKEMLVIRKKDLVTADQMKSLRDELDLCRFENDHMVCLLEGKESEIKEMRNLLNESDKLLDKYRARYSSSLDKYEKMFSDLQIHLEKFPEPSFLNSMRSEIEQLREENLELIRKNAQLEEQIKHQTIAEEQGSQSLANYMRGLTERIERSNSSSISEILNNFQKIEGQMIVLENEAIDWKDKCEESEEKYNHLLRENFALQKHIEELTMIKPEKGVMDCVENQTNWMNQESTVFGSKQNKNSMDIEPNPPINNSDRITEQKVDKQQSQVLGRNKRNKNGSMKNNRSSLLNIIICSGCGFNIRKDERILDCVECSGKIIRKIPPKMLR